MTLHELVLQLATAMSSYKNDRANREDSFDTLTKKICINILALVEQGGSSALGFFISSQQYPPNLGKSTKEKINSPVQQRGKVQIDKWSLILSSLNLGQPSKKCIKFPPPPPTP